jgi:CyaY protein
MTEAEFIQTSEAIFTRVEEWLEDSGIDLDMEFGASMLTITVEDNGSQIILSRQRAVSEIWLAAISGGFHFSKQGDDWICKTSETLQQLLNRVLVEQAGEAPSEKLVLDD